MVVPDLTRNPNPAIAQFLEMIHQAVAAVKSQTPDIPGHPFFGAKPDSYKMIVWANILAPGGHQAAHLHNYGWLSGVYYPSVPADISDESQAGWIAFGTSGYDLPTSPAPVFMFLRENNR